MYRADDIMTGIPLLIIVGAILVIVGAILYVVGFNASIPTLVGNLSCGSSLVQNALHNSSVISNATNAALLSTCTNASIMQGVGIVLVVIGVILLGIQYYMDRSSKKERR
ncbi:MAG: hypothetical protein QXL94_05255 [Candidatus Parvarchaeum sp.]